MAARDDPVSLAIERLHEDEHLTADLPDASAEAVYRWLEDEVRSFDAREEMVLAARITQLRRAVKQVAAQHADDPAALVAVARAASRQA